MDIHPDVTKLFGEGAVSKLITVFTLNIRTDRPEQTM